MVEHESAFDGIRVVGFTHIGAGPYALSLLADLGADVINIEPPHGDQLRTRDEAYPEISAYFLGVNRNKRSIVLDLHDAEDCQRAKKLVRSADVFVENYAPGRLEKFGLGYEELSASQPGLIYCSITAWGDDGPDAQEPGMDLLAQARGGMMGLNGEPGRAPARIPPPVADFIGTYLACFAISTALFHRERTGVGQRVATSLLAGQVATMANFIPYFWKTGRPAGPVGGVHPQLTPYQPFLAADGYFIVACLTDPMWVRLCEAIGRDDLRDDPRFTTNADRVKNREALIDILASIFVTRASNDWIDRLRAGRVPAGKIQSLEDLFEDPQVVANGYIKEYDHPVAGVARVAWHPVTYSETPPRLRWGASTLGQDTESVLEALDSGEGTDWPVANGTPTPNLDDADGEPHFQGELL